MRFHCLLYADRGIEPPGDALARYGALRAEMTAEGVLVAFGRLQPDSSTKVVRIDDGKPVVETGPVNDDGARPVGFFLIDCEDDAHAIGWAARIPAAQYGSVEVIPELVVAPNVATAGEGA